MLCYENNNDIANVIIHYDANTLTIITKMYRNVIKKKVTV